MKTYDELTELSFVLSLAKSVKTRLLSQTSGDPPKNHPQNCFTFEFLKTHPWQPLLGPTLKHTKLFGDQLI